MMTLLLEAALRSLILAGAVGLALRLVRAARNPHLQFIAWTMVLIGALAMPVLLRLGLLRVPSPEFVRGFAGLPVESLTVGGGVVADIPPWPLLVYAVIAGAILLRLAVGLVLTARLRACAQRIEAPWTGGRDVRASVAVASPVSFAGTILVPESYAAWPAATREAVLAHEGAHINRGDFYMLLLASVHKALFWFSPLAWWLERRLTALSEIASDEAGIAAVGNAADYADILMKFAARAPSSAVAMARPSTVKQRIELFLDGRINFGRPTWKARALLVACLLPLIALSASTLAQAAAKPFDADGLPAADLKKRGIVPPHSDSQNPVTRPEYPAEAKAAREAGVVLMRLTIDANGRVTDAVVHKSSGFPRLDDSAMTEAKARWQLLPGTIKGKPTPMTYRFAVTFKLTEDKPPTGN